MHVPDGFLAGEAAALGTVVAVGGLALCLHKVRGEQRERDLPVAGLAAAFFLVGDAPMIPVTIGTEGHLLGGALAVALLGPWLGAMTIAVVCAIQALALGDGGITTLGLNIVNLALIPALVGYPLIVALRRVLPATPRGLALACGCAAWVCVTLAAVVFVAEFALGARVVDRPAHAGGRHGRRLRADRARRGRHHGADRAGAAGRAPRPRPGRRAAPPPAPGGRDRRAAGRGGQAMSGRVTFVGAGPGAVDLLTLRAVRVLGEADVVVWARSLVDEGVLAHARPGAELVASDDRTLDDVVAIYERAAAEGLRVARVHSGDPTLYGALHEQLEACRQLGLEVEIVPGVSSMAGAAAALGQELTVPDVAQTLILTRRATRTTMPPNEELAELARHGATMVLFLSVRRPRELQADLIEGGYAPATPCAVVYRATWPDEIVLRCPLSELASRIREARITTQALVIVGPALDAGAPAGRSHVYDPGYGHRYRPLGRPDRYKKAGRGPA